MTHGHARARIPLVLIFLFLSGGMLVTCGTTDNARHRWNERWGAIVSHDSFPADCGLCHVPDRWDKLRDDFRFDHEEQTGHALEGAHERAACLRCHNDHGPVKAYVARGCGGCHLDPHQDRLGGDCLRCHTQESWRPGGLIAEHARTRFPLVGTHAAVACVLCHKRAPTGDFRNAPTRCELCHQTDLARARSPDHAQNGWVDRCERCHTPTTWPGGFLHSFFPLTGGHALNDCSRCHTGGFGPISSACYSCHKADFDGAPNHASGNFSKTCQQCHTTADWNARIDHSFFPLTKGHALSDCSRCHKTGIGPLPADCYSCHKADFDGARDHALFPKTCENCHTTRTWKGAVFKHRFPLRKEHNVDCSVCHPGNNTNSFSCLDCHDHRKSEMDKEHDEVGGYRYDSAACLQCHPNGED